MSTIERITITLTSDMADSVRAAVASGDYASSSEIIREALREWRHNRALREREISELRTDLRKGLDDLGAGRVKPFDPERIVEKGKRILARRDPST